MNKMVIADPGKCIGCRTCEIACVLAHSTADAADAMVKMSPASFNPRLMVVKTTTVSTPVQCRQCDDAPCAAVCPTGTLVLRNNTVEVIPSRCIGCKSCMIACRFGVIEVLPCEAMYTDGSLSSGTHVEAVKCDLCAHRANGPACVAVCPTKAISVIDADVLAKASRKRREHTAVVQTAFNPGEYPGQVGT